ncbi:zf-HC2 domain-containing protein [Candidatus Chloroploca sp. Khr17]|uniref:zf-HC2 domain-containing protein n=1 Tax=Candidatus Chloroploca sp. Khr17 TaxID=2496869 RepID=UPI00101C301E|nr:zf-HC2 domain-containing protein [Candidatus Chloroploca sp. Khr17]
MSIEEYGNEGCIDSPALSGIALLAVADGEADEETLAHVRTCPHCSQWVTRLRRMQTLLRQRLYRLECPSTEMLVDYCQGLLDPEEASAIRQHLKYCPHCHAEVNLLESSLMPNELTGQPSFYRWTLLP